MVKNRNENCIFQLDPEKISVCPDITYTLDHSASSSCARMKFESLTPPSLDISEAVELVCCAHWTFNTKVV
ncbi:unnamed protein product [Ixodes persulcatus]